MTWKKINLFGYDPAKDDFETTTFNIKQALNDNWAHVKELFEEARSHIEGTEETLIDKVDKEAGKGLSTNDYTDEEKEKIAGLLESINIDAETAKRYGFDSPVSPSKVFDRAVQVIHVTLCAAGWTDSVNADGWHTNQIDVPEMKETYSPDFVLNITSAALAEDERAAFGLIMECETFDGYVIARALEIPDIDINVRFTGV